MAPESSYQTAGSLLSGPEVLYECRARQQWSANSSPGYYQVLKPTGNHTAPSACCPKMPFMLQHGPAAWIFHRCAGTRLQSQLTLPSCCCNFLSIVCRLKFAMAMKRSSYDTFTNEREIACLVSIPYIQM